MIRLLRETFKALTRHLPETYEVLARHLPGTYQTGMQIRHPGIDLDKNLVKDLDKDLVKNPIKG